MLLYGIASSQSRDIEDFYATAAEAEAVLAQICADEPEFAETLWIQRVELELSAN